MLLLRYFVFLAVRAPGFDCWRLLGLREGLEDGGGFQVGLAVVVCGAVVHLEGGEYVFCGFVQDAGGGDGVADSGQFFLEPVDVRQAGSSEGLDVFGDLLVVVPAAQAGLSELFPGEEGAWVYFALGGDVAVADDVFGFYLVALDDVVQKGDEGSNLRGVIGRPDVALAASVDEFDAHRKRVDAGVAIPLTDSSMPGTPVFIDELVYVGYGVVGNEVVAADVLSGEDFQGVGVVGRGVVQDDD